MEYISDAADRGILMDSILKDITAFRNEYDAKTKSDSTHFNVFTILRNADDEVGLHSRFLYELLNPKAAHRQKGLFLYEFLKVLEHRIHSSILGGMDVDRLGYASVYREKDSIDLLILLPEGSTIIIENKIYAGDQPKQLERYFQTVITKHRRKADQVHIFYLTLDGHEPSACSVGELAAPVNTICYRIEIMNWLNSCIFSTYEHPNLQESIKQYRHLIMKLTDTYEGEEKRMMEKVVGMITLSSEDLQSALDLSKAVPYAKTQVMKELFRGFQKAMKFIGFEKLTYDEWDIEYSDKYYLSKEKVYPLQAYSLLKFKSGGREYSFDLIICIDQRLYYGFLFSEIEDEVYKMFPKTIAKRKFGNVYNTVDKIIKKTFGSDAEFSKDENEIYWELFRTAEGELYDFHMFNEACVSLLGKFDSETQRMVTGFADNLKLICGEWDMVSKEASS